MFVVAYDAGLTVQILHVDLDDDVGELRIKDRRVAGLYPRVRIIKCCLAGARDCNAECRNIVQGLSLPVAGNSMP